jgi:hypothetical protein
VPKKIVLPKSVAGAADKLYTLREQRYALQKKVTKLEEKEGVLREYLIDNLPKSDASGITGRIAHAEISKKPVPQVKDWPAFYKHILRTKDFSLMQRRLNEGAVKERWLAKKVVPGVVRFNAISVSITKK